MIAYYGNSISPHMTDTPEGYLICHDVRIARTGEQDYEARELRLDGDPYRTVTVKRNAADVFDPAALASFEGKDITDGHPPMGVGPETYTAYSKGHVQNVRHDGDYIIADLLVKDATLISNIRNNTTREVSCGYMCNYSPDGNGYKQTNIRGNHVAVVPRGRAGSEVAIKDAATAAKKGLEYMKKETKEAFYRFFGLAARDAEAGELEQLTKDAAAVLEGEPAKAQEPAPTVKVEDAKPSALEEKLDKLIELMMVKDAAPDKKLSDESDIDVAIAGAPNKDPEPEPEPEVPTTDGAVELLKKMRPAVAAIENKEQRAMVTDALLSAVKDNGVMGTIMQATQDSAKANAAKSNQTSYEKVCVEQQAAYDARNPHMKKEA